MATTRALRAAVEGCESIPRTRALELRRARDMAAPVGEEADVTIETMFFVG